MVLFDFFSIVDPAIVVMRFLLAPLFAAPSAFWPFTALLPLMRVSRRSRYRQRPLEPDHRQRGTRSRRTGGDT